MDTTPTSTVSSAPTTPSARPNLDPIGTLLTTAWQWFVAHWRKLLGIGAVMVAAQVGVILLVIIIGAIVGIGFIANPDLVTPAVGISAFLFIIIFGVGLAVLSLWMTVAVYVYLIANNATMTVRQAYGQARQHLGAYFGSSLLVGLYTLLGLLLLIIPGVYWGILYSFAPLIVLVEGRQARSLQRSKELVTGYWWAVFLRYFVFGLLTFAVSLAFSQLLRMLASSLSRIYPPLAALSGFDQFVSTLLITPINLIYSYLIYLNLRRIKG